MPYIVLTDEQLRVVAEATGTIEVRDSQGRIWSFLEVFSPCELEAILRHRVRKDSAEPGIPSSQVQALLQKAHEIDDQEGMTPEKMADLLRRARAGEAI